MRRFSVAELAKEQGCHKRTIYRAILKKELLATRLPTSVGYGGTYTMTARDVAAWLEKRRSR